MTEPTTQDVEPRTEAGHRHTADCECLPIRVVVDQHGHYWRDYGDHWSMCPVSTENVATEPVTEFYRFGEGGDFEELDPERLLRAMARVLPGSYGTDRIDDERSEAEAIAAEYDALRDPS